MYIELCQADSEGSSAFEADAQGRTILPKILSKMFIKNKLKGIGVAQWQNGPDMLKSEFSFLKSHEQK